ncbi:NAD(P)/FAD-dependent oxidoreductase [Marinobacter algicola]|uniref:NAD(P)/FAD-dependent oxidoreductase n=1 Tax=Marinobacter algicola TaxID=236100 RepID=UPI003BAAD660
MSKTTRYVIIGGGQAGGQAAITLRDAGFDGEIVLIGEEPLAPYERPPLSKAYLTDESVQRQEFRPLAAYAAVYIDCRFGRRVVLLDAGRKTLTLSDGKVLHWDKLLLATGGSPRRMKYANGPVHYLRTEADALALRTPMRKASKVVVIGGGVIGLEVAASARQLGASVTVVEPAERMMARMIPMEISRLMEQLHRDHHVDLRVGTSAHAIDATADGGAEVHLSESTLRADLVIVGIGIIPNTELAETAGLPVDNGILVDGCGRTAHPDIYAAGDVANSESSRYGQRIRLESWQNATRQAELAARAMCGEDIVHDDVPWFWSDQFDVNLQVAGLPHLADRTVFRGGRDPAHGVTAFHFAKERLIAVTTLNNARDMGIGRRLLSNNVQVTAEGLIDESIPLRRWLKVSTPA